MHEEAAADLIGAGLPFCTAVVETQRSNVDAHAFRRINGRSIR
jgi:hypothetical protein